MSTQFVLDGDHLVAALREAFEIGDATEVGRLAHALARNAGRLEQTAASNELFRGQSDLEAAEFEYGELERTFMPSIAS